MRIMSQKEIVVARYSEDLNWITQEPFHSYPYIVYNKGTDEAFTKTPNLLRVVPLPNVGRDMHTFLYHIIENYDNLADVTIFLLGTLFRQNRLQKAMTMIRAVESTNDTVFAGSCGSDMNKIGWIYNFQMGDGESCFKLADVRPFGKWFEHTFTNGERNECIAWNGLISVSREDIVKKPKSYYEALIKQLEDHPIPEAGHYFERALYAVFYPYKNITCLNV